ncbi:protein kinase [Gracilibacillus sp. YIM 98692]|uniref:protein kinase domain-containing protein n=1 Tax=Gracilibacillus sp. YIM 98692 TaxID=2663532 RepID=UPI0013D2B403|nr:protein kinase [Gracilibacillus sp. YIM 98692]
MISETLKKPDIQLRKGQKITGKWHHKSYQIVRELGRGAIGTVYLCVCEQKQVALKVSKQSTSITSEVNVLKTFQKVQGDNLGPALIDVDDYQASNGYMYAFYVMEYISGERLESFIRRNGDEWIVSLLIGFTKDLHLLHQQGYVFGDLKLDNLIVSRNPIRLRWVDVGGTTLQGRSIKEYTEFYDRAYWKMGERKADPGYDLFALVMVVLRIYYPNGFNRGNNPKRTLMQKINQAVQPAPFRKLLQGIILGHVKEAIEVKQYLLTYYYQQRDKKRSSYRTLNNSDEESYYPLLEMLSVLSVSGAVYLYVTIFLS